MRSTISAVKPIRSLKRRVPANGVCPCGSGLKWKRCHGRTVPSVAPADPLDVFKPDEAEGAANQA